MGWVFLSKPIVYKSVSSSFDDRFTTVPHKANSCKPLAFQIVPRQRKKDRGFVMNFRIPQQGRIYLTTEQLRTVEGRTHTTELVSWLVTILFHYFYLKIFYLLWGRISVTGMNYCDMHVNAVKTIQSCCREEAWARGRETWRDACSDLDTAPASSQTNTGSIFCSEDPYPTRNTRYISGLTVHNGRLHGVEHAPLATNWY